MFSKTKRAQCYMLKKSFRTLQDYEMVELKFLLKEVRLKRHRAWATHDSFTSQLRLGLGAAHVLFQVNCFPKM